MSKLAESDVTVLGLGRMGAALARALLAGERRLTVWNRDPAKAASLRGAGAQQASTLADAIAASPVIVVCLSAYAAWSLQVQNLPSDALRGRLVVQLTTGAADEAPPLEALQRSMGAQSLDGAILSFPGAVGTDDCQIYLSGARDAFERGREVLAPLGQLRFLGESVQLSNALDSALLVYAFGSMMSYLQAAALFEAAGLPISDFAEHADGVSRSFKSWVKEITPTIASRDYAGDQVTLDTMHGVWAMARGYAVRQGLPIPLLKAFETLSQTALDAGYGDAEFPAMMQALRGVDAQTRPDEAD